MSDKAKTAEQFFKEYGEVTRKYDLTETVQIPYSHIIELMQEYSKHQMSKELEEAKKELKEFHHLINSGRSSTDLKTKLNQIIKSI